MNGTHACRLLHGEIVWQLMKADYATMHTKNGTVCCVISIITVGRCGLTGKKAQLNGAPVKAIDFYAIEATVDKADKSLFFSSRRRCDRGSQGSICQDYRIGYHYNILFPMQN